MLEAYKIISLELGDAAEKHFADTLQKARENGKLPPWIRGWVRHEKNSQSDKIGRDFTIKTDKGPILVNVKNSKTFVKVFNQRHKGENIIAVVMDISKEPDEMFGKVIRLISARYREIKK